MALPIIAIGLGVAKGAAIYKAKKHVEGAAGRAAGEVKRSIVNRKDGATTVQSTRDRAGWVLTGQQKYNPNAIEEDDPRGKGRNVSKAVAGRQIGSMALSAASTGVKISVLKSGNLSAARKYSKITNTASTASNLAFAAMAGGPVGVGLAVAGTVANFAMDKFEQAAQDEIESSNGNYKARISQTNTFRMKGS